MIPRYIKNNKRKNYQKCILLNTEKILETLTRDTGPKITHSVVRRAEPAQALHRRAIET